ncbi:MAG: right-handed parallel beta-helix repeat-containing protein [Bacteroidia bacterium]|nr:right-handed parallel beta-helix repeat-containing protein [Bacteroidia bacterium]
MKGKINLHKILICILTMFATLNINAQVDPGVDFDLKGFIDQKINAGEKRIVIPPGRYRVPEFNNTHLYFNGKNDITIVADGVEMICTETVPAIKINNCKNFKMQGISVDYDPLPFTQGKIVAMSSDKNTLTIDLIYGYSTTLIGDKVEIYDSNTGELSTSTYYGVSYTVNTQTGRVILTKPSNYTLANSYEEVGDIVVIGSKSNKNYPHAILPDGCTGLVLENVTLYAGPTFGFFESNCSGSHYINCKVDRRPLATDIKQRGVKRMQSNNADAFHSKHAQVGPSYIQCLARYMGDDGIAINGDYHVVTATNGSKLTVVGKAGNTPNLAVGDSVELVSYTGKRFPNAQITKIEVGPALTAAEKQFLQNQTFYGNNTNTYKATNVYYVTINSSVDLPIGSLIASANRIGNGFEVKDCVIGPNRSRGILVKASNGIISGNRLLDNWGQAIKLAPEYVWLEAGSGSNVTVSDNVISGCHDASIAVYADGGNGETAPVGAHNNIQITGNSISGSSNPAIAVTSTSKLKLKGNTIESPNNELLVPWIMNNFGRKEDASREVYLKNVEIVEDYVGIEDKNSLRSFGIKNLKNPFSDFLRLEFTNPIDISYSIYNIMGRKIYSSKTGMVSDINTSDWDKGLYVLTVEGWGAVKLIKR